ncbi:hypothetical protein BA062_31335 [Prauserella flavalba]|uniref:Uncharacterized protein n=1 Tax=Prauserella flavalba TaxID=1477506 RepID=A0A318LCK7_9PSEU|nr:hypothetical protein BA062_31335 [Prauserella flavalba]
MQAIPTAANANDTSSAVGTSSSAHGEATSPSTLITPKNASAYRPPRSTAQAISPSAMSSGPMGVASIASYVFW